MWFDFFAATLGALFGDNAVTRTVQYEVRERGFFGWAFLLLFWLFNGLMALWLISYWVQLGKIDAASQAARAGLAIGGAIGTGTIITFWAAGAIILGLCAFFTRGAKKLITYSGEEQPRGTEPPELARSRDTTVQLLFWGSCVGLAGLIVFLAIGPSATEIAARDHKRALAELDAAFNVAKRSKSIQPVAIKDVIDPPIRQLPKRLPVDVGGAAFDLPVYDIVAYCKRVVPQERTDTWFEMNVCGTREEKARDLIKRNWDHYAGNLRSTCLRYRSASYLVLENCIEVATAK